jgi:HEAT repeat protein
MVMSDDPEVRANAYVALGHIGNRSAVPMVRASLGRGFALVDPMRVRIVELQAAEAMVRMGEVQEIEPIRAALFAPGEQGELTILACQIIGRLRDERSRPMLFRLVDASAEAARPPEIRIAALDALGRLGGGAELAAPLRGFLFDATPSIRAQAATAAGSLGSDQLLPDLARLLEDPEPVVRVAASGSILRLLARASG